MRKASRGTANAVESENGSRRSPIGKVHEGRPCPLLQCPATSISSAYVSFTSPLFSLVLSHPALFASDLSFPSQLISQFRSLCCILPIFLFHCRSFVCPSLILPWFLQTNQEGECQETQHENDRLTFLLQIPPSCSVLVFFLSPSFTRGPHTSGQRRLICFRTHKCLDEQENRDVRTEEMKVEALTDMAEETEIGMESEGRRNQKTKTYDVKKAVHKLTASTRT